MSEQNEFETNPVVESPLNEFAPEKELTIENSEYHQKLAGFWTRFWAYTIDIIVLYAISGILIKPVFRVFNLPIENPSFLFFTTYKATILIVLLLYFALMTKYLQQTVGKIIMGIKVVSNDDSQLTWNTIIFRELIGRFISKLLVIPYLLVAFTPKKEALHDIFADTHVVHEDAYEKKHLHNLMKNRGEQLPGGTVI
ncbi:RDD family protein [Sporosarcina sp. Marseille-Q4063]|uniref:RDD family protein n=1 Tax=Sporosarcina sp. Marseille-Q4063 TaxID=2810514 RepID=UPI001BAF3EC0|nr:RDD family protein [Sporosarcina sp. Marseille-Q4063]QUW22715.1 RDD family protein [Sporosarcina sp. Marseille-Q4063]